MPHIWSSYLNLKDEPRQLLAVSKGIAAYIGVVPSGRLSSGQQAKHLQF
jgi:7-keto-8-aminopelargonate synthetase-like enzyme